MTFKTDFVINKKDIISKFKKHVEDRNNKDLVARKNDDIEGKYSELDVLNKIKGAYNFILENSILSIRKHFIIDDDKFKNIVILLKNYISNKIRSKSDGTIYINVNDFLEFNGDEEQYRKWFVDSKRDQEKIMRNIVDEFNKFLSGNSIEEKYKTFINDTKTKKNDPEKMKFESIVKEIEQESLRECGF